ncbi:MAG: tetratricopeptide repeat protein [Proteobacteria bacterium]|nr:tetratricopeptide repeat protein [Pseudomonadota bacterium]
MPSQNIERKLTAILSADVKGYSRLMGEDEESTLRTLNAHREVMVALIDRHRGRVVDATGDNLLAEFSSVLNAVQCAVEIQKELGVRNAELPENRKMEFRIGVNLGDVIEEGERIYGDGVNIAARLESLAEGGGICISGSAFEQVENKLVLGYEYLGERTVKNIKKPVRVYRVMMEPEAAGSLLYKRRRDDPGHKRSATLILVAVLVGIAGALVIWNFFFRTAPPKHAPLKGAPAQDLPDKPSIAVLPFINMSGDPEQEYFSDGLTEDLITDLSRVSGLFVIARNSVFTYKGKAVKVEEVGQDLGVRYVLEGSVRKSNGRVRITAQLIDATTRGHVWAERYDRELRDIFDLQDEVTQRIVAALAVKLSEDEETRLARRGTDNLEAFDYYLQALEYQNRFTRETNLQARRMFEKALELDPEFATAYAYLGWNYLREWFLGWSQNPQTLQQALGLAEKAIELDESIPEAHCLLSNIYLWKKQHDRAIAVAKRSIQLSPSYADAIAGLGGILSFTGRPEETIGLVKRAMRLNPMYPVWYLWNLGHAYFLTGQRKEAIAAFTRALERNPNFHPAHIYLAVIYSEQGREEDAAAKWKEFIKRTPETSLEAWRQRLPYRNQADLERVLEALRKAKLI